MIDIKEAENIPVGNLLQKHQYYIPIYQRNYAWGFTEITQLIDDLWNAYQQNNADHHKLYYIGSLVVARRSTLPDKKCSFETIDGQQRHTTLCIIAAALQSLTSETIIPELPNLSFDSRPSSNFTLNTIFSQSRQQIDTNAEQCNIEHNIIHAYKITRNHLKGLQSTSDNLKEDRLKEFKEYIFNSTIIARIIVPKDTDLNHYFEIMNNRGEQLETHEVLKARMLGYLENSTDRQIFSIVWDACADMQHYAITSIPTELRKAWFGNDYRQKPDSFLSLIAAYNNTMLSKEKAAHNDSEYSNERTLTLKEIIDDFHPLAQEKIKNKPEDYEQIESIIDFPNFLIHVLHITTNNIKDEDKEKTLNDKKLLSLFDEHLLNNASKNNFNADGAKTFILNLLRIRLDFDKYLIKRILKDWSLKSPKSPNRAKESISYLNTFDGNCPYSGVSNNQHIVMLQAMFHVSFPSNTYKRWLLEVLNFLNSTKQDITQHPEHYIGALEKIACHYVKEQLKIQNVPISPLLETLHQGTAVPNFVFNYLDYHLWKRMLNGTICFLKDYKNKARNFSFTFRSSVEHYWPQHPIAGAEPLDEKDMNADNFANLCLISHDQNSRLSNHQPEAKKDYYKKSTTIESLKQIVMMSYEDWAYSNNDPLEKERGITNMREHLNNMVEVLNNSLMEDSSHTSNEMHPS